MTTASAAKSRRGPRRIRPDLAPIVRPRRDYYVKARIAKRFDNAHVAWLGIVIPRHGNHVLRKRPEQLRIFHRDITPEHELLVIGLENAVHLLNVFEIDAAQPYFGGAGRGLSMAE